MIKAKRLNTDWQIVTNVGIAFYLIVCFIYLFLGKPNSDEGWYLYASKLVFEGKIPYQDFAFTQMPLLPYIYGILQFLLPSSIYLGRLTSVILSAINLLLCVRLACKYAGKRGGGLAAMLLCSFTFGIYFVSIVKTYALVSLLFTLTFFVLSSDLSDNWKYPLAVALSLFSAMVRLSAIMFFIPVALYCLAATFRSLPLFFRVIATCFVILSSFVFFLYPNTEAAKWGLLTYHISQWKDIGIVAKISRILFFKIPDFIKFFNYYFLLLVAIALTVIGNARVRKVATRYIRENPHIPIIGIGLFLFSISHLGTGDWQLEYFVPAIISFLPIIAIAFDKLLSTVNINNFNVLILWFAMAFAIFVAPIRQSGFYIDFSGNQLPLEEIRDLSNYIVRKSKPTDKLLVLEALWIAVDSGKTVLPGITMSQFSYQDISMEDAKKLKVVNGDMLLEYIKSCSAKIVVLTDYDWLTFKHRGYEEIIRQELLTHYKLSLTKRKFGQGPDSVYVYLCNTEQK